jgi:solute carrier family 8 (sodium/calcium exchanger)
VDKLIKKTNLALVIGTHSWREQFLEAVTVSAGKWGGREEETQRKAAPTGPRGRSRGNGWEG